MISLQSLFWSSLYSLLTLVFARYSPFYFSLFLFSIVFSSLCSAYSSRSIPISRFSRLAPHLLSSFSLWSLSLSLFGLSLSLWSLSLSLFLPFGKGKSCSYEYRCFASLLEIAKYQESLFNNNLTSMISRSKHGLQILSLRCFTSSNQPETFLGF